MGKLNRKIAAKVGVSTKASPASKQRLSLSHHAIIAKKETLAELTNTTVSTVKQANQIKGSGGKKGIVNATTDRQNTTADHQTDRRSANTKKAIRATLKHPSGDGRRIGKKDRMKVRKDLLMKRLAGAEAAKKSAKAKRLREKTVIVKDLQPLVEDLDQIANTIKKEEMNRVIKERGIKKKKGGGGGTQKQKKRQEQFLKDLEFMRAATADPGYKENPLAIITTHIVNTLKSSPQNS